MNAGTLRRALRRLPLLEWLLAALLVGVLSGVSLASDGALPTGGRITSGEGSIAQSGGTMWIDQESDRMIVDWESFDIGRDASVVFRQPDAQSVALNRVSGHNPSHILGSLSANGKVFLINPRGVVFGEGAQVDVGALVASTLDISDADFLSGTYRFTAAGPEAAAIENRGRLSGSVVALLAPVVRNEGRITGDAALAAGTEVVLDFDGDGLIGVQVPASTVATLVENRGVIETDGELVVLTARGASEALRGVVNHSGVIRAEGLASDGGRIFLLGDMRHGEVFVGGSLSASFIETSAAEIKPGEGAVIDARGGTWLIDPVDITIDEGMADFISSTLERGNVVVDTSDPWGTTSPGPGDIDVDAPITWTGRYGLTLKAGRSIHVNSTVRNTGTDGSGALTLIYAQSDASGDYYINAPVYLPAGNTFRTQKGSESVTTYQVITTVEALQAMQSNANYALGTNIVASSTQGWNSGAGFAPISTFYGKFDGLGHTITGLYINRPEENAVGLFGSLSGSVRHLRLSGSVVGKENVGLLAGGINNATVERVSLLGSVKALGKYAGGVTGLLWGGTIDDVHSTAQVEGDSITGGLVGYGLIGEIRRSSASGSVSVVGSEVGGLVGASGDMRIEDSFASGNVTGGGTVGGLVGRASANSKIARSYATGAVTGRVQFDPSARDYTGYYVGGLVAINRGVIEDAFASGAVSGHSRAGGLVGWNDDGTLRRVYATGNVDGNGFVGTLVGHNSGWIEEAYAVGEARGGFRNLVYRNDGRISKSFALDDLAWGGDGTIEKSEVVTEEEMRDPFTFIDAGWDFANVWGKSNRGENGGYMMLRSAGGGQLYDDYVRLSQPTEKTYGQANPDLTSLAEIVGRGNVTVEWGGLINERTSVGTYAYDAPGVVNVSTTSSGGAYVKLEGALTVNKAKLIVSVSDVGKIYDGKEFHGPDIVAFNVVGFVNGEDHRVLEGDIQFGGPAIGARNAGTYTLTVSGFSAKNYEIEYKDARLIIAPRPISLSGARIYDGTRILDASIFSLNNLVDGEELILTGFGLMDDKHVGEGKKFDLYTLQLQNGADGTLASNYTLEGGVHTVDITPLQITQVMGIRAENKVYDGTKEATIDTSQSVLVGALPNDEVEIEWAKGEFADKDAGKGKTVYITEVALTGDDARNYTVVVDALETTADIDRRTIFVEGVVVAPKQYDGTTEAVLENLGELVGVIEGDHVELDGTGAWAEFEDPEPGSGKTVVVSGLVLTGRDATNYELAPVTATGEIAAAPEPPGQEEPPVTPERVGPTVPEPPAGEAPAPFEEAPLIGGVVRAAYQGELQFNGIPAQVSVVDGRVVLTLLDVPEGDGERPVSEGSLVLFVGGDGGIAPLRSVAISVQGNQLALESGDSAFEAAQPEASGATPVGRVLLNLPSGRAVELVVSLAADGSVWVSGTEEAREELSEDVVALIVLAMIEREAGLAPGSVKAIVLQ